MRHRGLFLSCLLLLALGAGLFFWWQNARERAAHTVVQAEPKASAVDPDAVSSAASAAAVQPAAKRRPADAANFDRRLPGKKDVVKAREPVLVREERRQAAARLEAALPGVRVDFDETLGSPLLIASTKTLLTGANGEGGAVSAERMGEFAADDPHRVVKGFVAEHAALFGYGPAVLAEARVTRDYETPHNGMHTTVWQQELDGIRVFESTFQAHRTKRGELVNVSSRFVPDAEKAAAAGTPNNAVLVAQPVIDAKAAVSAAAETLGERVAPAAIVEKSPAVGPSRKQEFRSAQLLDVGAEFVWLPQDEKAMRLCWEVIFMSKARGEMFRTLVDAENGQALLRQRLTEYIGPASYRVFTSDSPTPMSPGPATPTSTQPPVVARTLVTLEALSTTASPNGWIDDGVNETRGNNVDAHLDVNADNAPDLPRPQGAAGRVFDFPLDLAQAPSTYGNAAVTDLFYWNNYIHDRYYQLGFTEAAGNFQNNTFGRGGVGNDAVQADAQDGSGTDNANFSTPPDGSAGRMQMYVFTGPTPDRDGDFDHEIVIHEYTHGLSNRLVGGGVGISALQPRGMGEGWSDFYGISLLSEPADDPNAVYAAGGYATYQLSGMTSNYYFGIRRYPYSTDLTKNPLTFRDIDPTQARAHTGIPLSPRYGGVSNGDPAAVHGQGEVWCVTLWDARANLIARHGAAAGNELMLQLVTDGMKLAPANPTFLQARDAIIQADLVNNAGANRIELWTAFAKRGMGSGATSPASSSTNGVVEAYDLPDDLSVTVGTVLFKGDFGGPFTPSTRNYALANTGAAPLAWTATDDQPWLTLSAASGSLAPGAGTTVTASLNAAANSLANGLYTAVVAFTNTTSGAVISRTITLRVGQVDYFTELFDTSAHDLDNQSFLFTPNATLSGYSVQRQPVTAFYTTPTGGTSLPMSDDTFAQATLTGGQQVRLYGTNYGTFYVGSNGFITFGQGSSELGESFAAHFALPRISALMDDLLPTTGQVTWRQTADRVAVTWLNVPQFSNSDSNSFQIEMFFDGRIRITNLAIGASDGLIGLSRGTGLAVDFLESDFSGYASSTLTLLVPATAAENGGTVTATLQVVPAPTAPLTVTLSSSNLAAATVPASVVVPAGQASRTFPVTLVDDTLLDGTQTTVITATAATFATGTATINVEDSETATLTLTVPATATEGGANLQGTVTSSAAPSVNVVVTLVSANPAEVQVPASVTIPAGQTSATFAITIVNDNRLDGTVTTGLSAQVGGWTTGAASIAVADNDTASLAVNLAGPLREGDGTRTGTVQLGGTLPTALTITLASDDTTELTVPASVIVPAGSISANFTATIVNDALADGAQPVQITATAPGFVDTSLAVTVADNDAHHFNITPVAATQIRNAPFTLTVAAKDVNDDTITNFNSPVALTAAVSVTPATLTNWVGGVWTGPVTATAFGTGVVLTANDGQGHTGASNAFDVTTGPLAGLAWSVFASQQNVDAPFAVTLRAVDAGGNSVPEFTGPAVLSAVQTGVPEAFPITPSEAEEFVAGEWSGNVTVPFTATELRLRATAGVIATNSPAFAVTAALPPSTAGTIFSEDFESGVFSNLWTRTGTGNFRTQITTYLAHGGTRHMAMDEALDSGSYARNEATLTLNLAGRTGVVLKFWAAQFGDEPEGPPPAPFPSTGADFDGVAISADGGINWYEVQPLRSLSNVYTELTVDLDAAIAARGLTYSSAFKIRFNQYDNFSLGTDGIGIDDILVTANVPPSGLVLTLPAQVSEGAGLVNGTVSVSVAPVTNLVLTLASKAAAKITVPATVTILAGQTSAVLPLTVIDDRYIDGTKNVVITASAPGFLETGEIVEVTDNDGGTLTLTLPATAGEASGSITGTLRLSTPALVPITVVPLTAGLVSDHPAAALPPASVTVPRGAVSAPFTVTIPDDTLIDGEQLARITATLAGWVSGTAEVRVQDNESRELTVAIPARFRETDTPKTGTVRLNGSLATNLTVTLTSDDVSEITVPASVVIPAGQMSATFAITVQDDLLADGAQPFTITASAATFTAGTASGQVRDNEAHHFTFAPIGNPMVANGPIPAIITARDPLGAVLSDYNSPVTLSAANGSGPLPVTPVAASAFLNGVSNGSVQINALTTGVVLTATASSGAVGSSNAFDLVDGQINRFVWDAIPSAQTLDTPFTATVRAVNAAGTTVTGYNGVANLYVLAPTENPAIGTNNTTTPSTLNTFSHDARSTALYLRSEVGGASRITAVAFNVTSIRAGGELLNNLTIRLKHTALTNLGGVTSWDNAGWTQVYRASPLVAAHGWVTFVFTTPFDFNGTSNLLMDLSFDRATTNSTSTFLQGSITSSLQTVTGASASTNGDPLNWTVVPAPTAYFERADVRLSTTKELPIRPPQSGAFASGVWTGPVSVPVTGNGVSLRARAGAVNGASAVFNVAAPSTPPLNGGASVFVETFESGTLNPSFWTITGTGSFHAINSALNGPRGGTQHLTMDAAPNNGFYARNEATLTLNLTGRTGVALSFWAKGFNEEPNGPPASPFPSTGADFDGVAISADGGTNWFEVQALRTLTGNYTQFTVNLDAALAARGLSYGANFKIRFNQYGFDSLPNDGIAIDDILIAANPLPGYAINVPSQLTEGAGAVAASLSLDVAASTDTVVNLTSSAPSEITVPPVVIIPAGQTSASFDLTVLDDSIVDGSRMVAISGTSVGQLPRSASVTVLDNESLPLGFTVPATIAETAAPQTGTITLGAPASSVVTVNLVSSDPTELQIPANVIFQLGQTTATFPITVVNDTDIDGTQAVTLTASVAGGGDTSAIVQVTDNENRNLTLSGLSSAYEGVTSTGTVALSGTLPTALIVTLTSSNPAQYSVPASVTIPAGQTSATFIGTAVEDTATDGTQNATITASSTTFTNSAVTVSAFDNDIHRFTFSTIASPKATGVPFSITVTAKDVNNVTITPFSGSVALSAAGNAGAVTLTPTASGNFSSGVWTGNVTCGSAGTNVRITASGQGVTSVSNAFAVQQSPAMAFSPASHTLTLNQGQSTTRPLTISNIGGGSLNWTIATAATLAEVVSVGPEFVGIATDEKTKTEALTLPDSAQVYAEPRAPENVENALATLSLQSALNNLNANNALVRSAIPGRYAFSEGVTGTNINDGGADMYDGGNYLGTNLGGNLNYSDNLIINSTLLGTGGQYFTRKYDGLWVFAANVSALSYFEITGDVGADGGGSTDSVVLSVVRDGVTYRGFVKRIYGTSDPSVNHLIIVADNGSVTHTVSTNTNDDLHRLTSLTGVTRIYYVLYAGTAGGYINDAATLNLMNVFLDAISAPDWVSPNPASGTVAGGASQNVTLTVDATNLTAGVYNRTLLVNSNDPAQPSANFPVTLTVTALPNLAVSPATGLTASGSRGGPFTPTSQAFTLTNSGTQALAWTAAKTATWLNLSATSGTLNAGASVTVTATLNAGAAALSSGPHADTLTFTNTTNGIGNTTRPVALTVMAAGELAVSPALELAATGPFGGPFTPASRSYTLSNPGDAALTWTAVDDAPWVTLSSAAGTLAPGASTTVTATINAATTAPDNYTGTLTFTNTTNNRGNTTRALSLAIQLPAPQLNPEPPTTGGTDNTVSWSAIFGALEYEVQAAPDAAFTNPVSSGLITGTTYTFTGLDNGQPYFYRVRARRFIPGATSGWTQTSQADFQTGTGANVSLTERPGNVALATGTVWTENFDATGSTWSNTLFSLQTLGAASTYVREALSSTVGAPLTTPALPINQGGDLEGRFAAPSTNSSARVIMPATVAANIMTDGSIEGYLGHGIVGTVSSHTGSFLLRTSSNGSNAYAASIARTSATGGTVSISKWTNGVGGSALATGNFTASFGTECYRLRFTATGSTLTASVWIVRAVGGVVQETPVTFTGGSTTLTVTDASYASGVAGIYCIGSTTNSVFFDDITVTKFGTGTYFPSGTYTAPVVTPPVLHRWGTLGITKDTYPAGTALTVDVLNAGGTLLAANLATGADLGAIPAIASQTSIRLRANLSTTNNLTTPLLNEWTVSWQTGPDLLAESGWSPAVSSVQDASAPMLSVTTPVVTLSPLLSLTGLGSDLSGIASVTVNGTPALTTDGFLHWSTAPIALTPGWNNLALAATDAVVPANALARDHAIYLTTPAGDADLDGLPDIWEATHGLDAFSDAGDSGALGDFDKDGLANLLERGFGLNPGVPDLAGAPRLTDEINPADGLRYLVVRFNRLLAPAGLTYAVEVSGDLAAWSADTARFEEIPPPVANGDGLTETVAVRVLPAIGTPGHPGSYIRVRVTAPPLVP